VVNREQCHLIACADAEGGDHFEHSFLSHASIAEHNDVADVVVAPVRLSVCHTLLSC